MNQIYSLYYKFGLACKRAGQLYYSAAAVLSVPRTRDSHHPDVRGNLLRGAQPGAGESFTRYAIRGDQRLKRQPHDICN